MENYAVLCDIFSVDQIDRLLNTALSTARCHYNSKKYTLLFYICEKKYKKHKIAVIWMVLSGHLLSLTLAFFLKSTYLIHENITCSVVKRISWHIYGALDIDFPALCLLLMSFFSVLAAGLQVVPESRPYRQRAGSSIRRRREHLFSAVLMLSPLNKGSWGA